MEGGVRRAFPESFQRRNVANDVIDANDHMNYASKMVAQFFFWLKPDLAVGWVGWPKSVAVWALATWSVLDSIDQITL